MLFKTFYNRFWGIAFLLLCSLGANAQVFEIKQSLDFLSIQNPDAQIVDLNNDGKLDVFLCGEDVNGDVQHLILGRTIGVDSAESEVFNVFPTDVTMGKDGAFIFSDLNNDNLMDLIISGRDLNGTIKNEIHFGTFDYGFQSPTPLPDFEAENIEVADLNNDGQKEIIWQGIDADGNPALQVLSTNNGMNYEPENIFFPGLHSGSLVLFDFDKNNYVDLLYQGLDDTGNPATVYLNNDKDFGFAESQSDILPLSNGSIKVADYDADGFADVLVHGINALGQPTANVYFNKDSIFELAPINLVGIGSGHAQFADLNYDGLVDISLQGEDVGGVLANLTYLQDSTGTMNLIPNLIPNGTGLSQLFGDFYFDGNLDVLQWKRDGNIWVFEFLQNTELDTNSGPFGPAERYAIQTFDDVKLFWSGSFDDKTPTPSISHDIYIGMDSLTANNISPSFHLADRRRTLVGHGNQSLNSELNIFDLAPDIYYYGVQGVDNAFHANSRDTGAIGSFIEDSFVVCDELNVDSISICQGGEISLNENGNPTAWYSTAQGLLGFGFNIPYVAEGSDTLFFSTPGSLDCADQGAVIVSISLPSALVPLVDFVGCQANFGPVEYLGAADSVLWTLMSSGETMASNPALFSPDENDMIFLEIYECGLTFYDTMSIELYPTVTINVTPPYTEIFIGESVQLNATGAMNYNWTPGSSLSQDDISNPTAQPNQTTIYEVIGSDAFGCEAFGTATIVVYDFQNLPDVSPCPGEEVSLFFPHNFDSIEWTIESNGNVFSNNPFSFIPTQPTAVFLRVEVGSLVWLDTIQVNFVPFEITVAADTLEMMAGDSVQLAAFGADNYTWSPSDGLSQTDISDPIAMPGQTTLYTVTGNNSALCEDSATVLVYVYTFENLPDVEVCLDDQLTLFFPEEHDDLLWTVDRAGLISNQNGLTFIPTQDDTVFLEVYVGDFIWYDTIAITSIFVDVTVAEDTVRVVENEPVQLQAFGADAYVWVFANGLNRPDIANPIATLSNTTQYQVTGFVSGCSGSARVLVIVSEAENIFIPTLFTPNLDNRNETFRIYGNALPTTLNFEIFNRSGQRVYLAESVVNIATAGWDGTHNGDEQPAGVYYWKATGTNADGSAFSYKGKNKGAVHLLR